MSRVAYVNGRYLPLRNATVHIEDRGYQFGDGVYEVCEVRGGRPIDERRHMARLKRSLDELRIRAPAVVCRAACRAARSDREKPHRLRHRLPANHPRRSAARPCLSSAGRGAESGGDRAYSQQGAQRDAGRQGHRGRSACRTTAGAVSTSRRSASCPMCWRGRPPSSKARATPGSSIRTAPSPKALRPMPGS